MYRLCTKAYFGMQDCKRPSSAMPMQPSTWVFLRQQKKKKNLITATVEGEERKLNQGDVSVKDTESQGRAGQSQRWQTRTKQTGQGNGGLREPC